jgi:S-formylglutathione hydrolase
VFGHPRERFGAALLIAAVLLTACGSGSTSPTASATSDATAGSPTASSTLGKATCSPLTDGIAYKMSSCQVDAPSLAGNLLGDPASLSTYVLTPIDYQTSGIRYPVVYMLAGYTDPATGIAYSLEAAPEPNQGSPVNPIIVVVSGVNALGGGFYVNSTVSGNWEDAIVKDLVGYVDTNYRTIAKPASRGVAGHSMGGFGAVNAAMRHPDVFGALFAEAAGLFDADGAQARLGDPTMVQQVLAIEQAIVGANVSDAAAELKNLAASSEGVQVEIAYGTAFDPDPKSSLLMQFPFRTENGKTVRDDALWAKWEAGFGGLSAKLAQYESNLRQLHGIVVDYGTADEYPWIPKGDHYFVGLLQTAGISVVETTFNGGHNDQVGNRLVTQMLPFMQEKLSAS